MGGYGLPVVNTVARVTILAAQGFYGVIAGRAGDTRNVSATEANDQKGNHNANECKDQSAEKVAEEVAEENAKELEPGLDFNDGQVAEGAGKQSANEISPKL